MNIIYGGSFNPITKAHLEIADFLIKKFKPKSFIFLPVGDDYNKDDLVDANDRYNMIKLSLMDGMTVSDYEIKNKYLGTYTTLKNLKLANIHFIIGSDNLELLSTWDDYEKLISEFNIIVINREVDTKIDKSKYNLDNIIFIDGFHNDISSSKYRKSKDSKMIDNKVLKYIEEKKLY